MRVLLLRHPPCEQETGELSDARLRELRRVFHRLRRLQKQLDAVACGPSPGALETARKLAAAYRKIPVRRLADSCADESPEEIVVWLRTQASGAAIAIVDEEPALGRLAGFLTCGRPSRALALKVSGICRIDCNGPPAPAGGMLRWLLTPMQLQNLKV